MKSLMQKARLVALTIGLLLMAARPASAGYWWLTWLDELSGPGPYHGPIVSVDVWCFGTETLTPEDIKIRQGNTNKDIIVRPAFCKADRANTVFGLQLEMGFWDDNPDPARYSGDAHLKSFQLVAYFPVHKIFATDVNRATRAIEFGAGLGAYKLTGQTVIEPDYWRGSVPLRVRVMPSELFFGKDSKKSPQLRRALQAIQVRAGWDFLPGTVSSDSFNGLPSGKTSNEFVKTVGVQFDLGSLFWAGVKKD